MIRDFDLTLPGGAPGNYFTFKAATDLVPPSIVHTPIPEAIHARWPIDVFADVTDILGRSTVECEFRINRRNSNNSSNGYWFPVIRTKAHLPVLQILVI